MLTVPATIQTLFKTDGIRKNFRVHFPNGENADLTNSDIVQESVTFTESVCSQNVFQFGLSERSEIDFECVGVQNIYGMTIECGIEIDTSSLSAAQISAIQADPGDGTLVLASASDIGYGYYRVPYGVFIVESCPRSHGAMQHRRVTAYSEKPSGIAIDMKLTAYDYPFNSYLVSSTVLYGATDPTLSAFSKTTVSPSSFSYGGPANRLLYDSSGRQYNFGFQNPGGNDWKPQTYFISDRYDSDPKYDFGRLTFSYDPEAYEELGTQLAAALDADGYDLTYNAGRTKVYDTNEQALRAIFPYFFYPCLFLYYRMDGNSNTQYLGWDIPIKSGELFPIYRSRNYGIRTVDGWQYSYSVGAMGKYGNSQIALYRGVNPIDYFYLTNGDPDVTISSLELFGQSSSEVTNMTVSSTLTIPGEFPNVQGNNFADGYTYANAFSMPNVIDGLLEMHAQFGRTDRSGNFDKLRLATASPEYIAASEYSEFWWDDYSINGVGTVKFSINAGNSVCRYEFGIGSSEYDMTNNAFLNNLKPDDTNTESAIIAGVIQILDTEFIPYLSGITFTPSDAKTIGLPYIEAGDYLEIDDADNGSVYTYMLHRSVAGIQLLEDSFEASGGEIIRGGQP